MKSKVTTLLKTLRAYAIEKGLRLAIDFHQEDSYLMRFANSAISLNTNEKLTRLDLTAYEGRKRATYSMIADPNDIESIKSAIDTLAEMIKHAAPLSYEPTFPVYKREIHDDRAFCPNLAKLSNQERLDYFNTVAGDLESDDIKLSGNFADGTTINAQMSTETDHVQYFISTDAQILVVLSSLSLKWEVNAEQSAQRKRHLDPQAMHEQLALLVKYYQEAEAVQLPVGKYKVVFGPAAIGEVLSMMGGYAMDGGMHKLGYSFLSTEDIGKQLFSPDFQLVDDPNRADIFGQMADFAGMMREPFSLVQYGVFKGFTWDQDAADEHGQTATGHSVSHTSMAMKTGDKPVADLAELLAMPRDEDILYIPYIHYMNMVNPSAGMFTGSSRFGALYLKADGTVQVPYNVRLTQKFTDLFGERIEWMSATETIYNVSSTYSRRNPTALAIPKYMCVKDIEISHSNPSY